MFIWRKIGPPTTANATPDVANADQSACVKCPRDSGVALIVVWVPISRPKVAVGAKGFKLETELCVAEAHLPHKPQPTLSLSPRGQN